MQATNGKMAHCPNVVQGAQTSVKDVDKGVELTVTATDPAATADIRARAKSLVADSLNQSTSKHTGGGGGGGIYGKCPVILKDVTLAAVDIDNGTKLTVTPNGALELDWLRRETRNRVERLGEAGAKGAGEQRMANCPSSVDGATTTVTAAGDSVAVLVTAKSDDATKQIRSRAQHALTIAKGAPGAGGHDGKGDGGGGIGRCPVFVKGATIDVKDVDGGSQITMKPKNASDLASLRTEAQSRAAKFQVVTK